jgi:beta-glucoside operon transcriptional antiterminator
MLVVKKINNNVAVCRDGNQRELIAFGKGIGFPPMPYELTDLEKIDRTFYNVSSQYLPLLNDIPGEIVEFTAQQLDEIRSRLPYETSPNFVLTLADHIAFSIERAKKGIYLQMPSVYELEQGYPLEVQIGRHLLGEINRRFRVRLPKSEVQSIAMHFINARDAEPDTGAPQGDIRQQYDEVLEQTTQIIEWEMQLKVARDTFNYARFATHLQYLLDRLFTERHIDTDNLQLYGSIREEYPAVAACVDKISDYYKNTWQVELSEEEKLYLMLHVNRVCAQ